MKSVASTLTSILENPTMQAIQDRSIPVQNVTETLLDYWKYDVFSRKPSPAYLDNGAFIGTDLDLVSFLSALADRNAVINIPKYQSMRAKTLREGERVVSNENRHGKILGVTSNKEVFTFGLRMLDMNVITENAVGGFRNFSLTNLNGDWYGGWSSIEFSPDAKENKFLEDKSLWSGNQVIFKNFVSPNRWVSLYGAPYFMTKALIERLSEQAKNYKSQIDEMLKKGIKYPSASQSSQEWPESETGVSKSITVKAFQVEIDVPESTGEFKKYNHSSENLETLTNLRRKIIYDTIPQLRFACRATELAFYKHGNFNFPAWITDAKWEQNYVVPGKRNKWSRLVLFQPKVGELGVALRVREYDKTERVSESYSVK